MLKYLANTASQMPTVGNVHILLCILEAVASLDLSSVETKVRVMNCLINKVQQLSMYQYDLTGVLRDSPLDSTF